MVPLPETLSPPQKTVEPFGWVDVVIAHDVEPAIDEAFEAELKRDYPGAQRISLEFLTPPVVVLAPEVMGEYTQRMLRALVLVKPLGEVELLTANEYDVPYMDAIRDSLASAKASPTPDQEIRWAILVFWFQRIGPTTGR